MLAMDGTVRASSCEHILGHYGGKPTVSQHLATKFAKHQIVLDPRNASAAAASTAKILDRSPPKLC